MTKTAKTHSAIGASSMHRWSECPGSIALSEGIHVPSSRYAAEGTCAHDIAEECEKSGADPDLLLGAKRTVEDHEFTVDEEMVEGVRLYLESGADVFNPAAGDVKFIERQFDLSHVYPGLYGTNDRVIWKPTQRRLIVDDFKYGAGIPVEVKGNKQLMYYALGAVLTLKLPVMEIVLRIIQPRCPHPDGPVRKDTMNALDLMEFQGALAMAAAATKKAGAPRRAGDWCKFCPASGICPEHAAKATEAAAMVFDTVEPGKPIGGIDYEKLAEAMKLVPIVKAWCENVHALAYAEAEKGARIPGFKLVDKVAHRSWKDVAAAEKALKELGLGETTMYPIPELKSPAQIEKVLKELEFKPKERAEVLEPLVEKKSSGHALAPDTDKRAAVTNQTAAEAFANA